MNWNTGAVPTAGSVAIIYNGTVVVSSGFTVGSLTVDGGILDWTGGNLSGNLTIASGAAFDIAGATSMTLSGGTLNNAGVIEQSGGTTTVQSVFINTSGAIKIDAGTLVTGTPITGGALTVGTAATSGLLQLAPGSGTTSLSSLTIFGGSSLDITTNTLRIDYGSAADPNSTIRGYIHNAYNGGEWTGTGLTSSAVEAQIAYAKVHGGGIYAIGYADGSDPNQTLAVGSQLVYEPTLTGDADLNGSDNFVDFTRVAKTSAPAPATGRRVISTMMVASTSLT